MTEQVHERTGHYPEAVLADGGFASHEGIDARVKGRLGLGSLLVRSVEKVTCAVLLTALAFNLLEHASKLVG